MQLNDYYKNSFFLALALMTYCYTGHIVISDSNVAELLNLSHYYGRLKKLFEKDRNRYEQLF